MQVPQVAQILLAHTATQTSAKGIVGTVIHRDQFLNENAIINQFFLVSYVGERLWRPIQRPNQGRKKKAKGSEEREIRSSLSILDLKEGKLLASGKEEEGKTFHKLHV